MTALTVANPPDGGGGGILRESPDFDVEGDGVTVLSLWRPVRLAMAVWV